MIPPLHLVTDDEILLRPDFLAVARGLMEVAGASLAFHLRGPRTNGRKLFLLAESLLEVARDTGSTILVNDRVDLALSLGFSGAHLGQRSLPAGVARRILGPHRLLGVSVHSGDEAASALEGDVDFLLVGTIFPSGSHPGSPPQGVTILDEVRVRAADVPLVAIGGISTARTPDVLSMGVEGVAVRGGIWDPMDPKAACLGYLEELEKGGLAMTTIPMIEVHINGKDREVPVDLSLHTLLEWLGLNPALVVVEMNREILERGRYPEVLVSEGDVLELVHFVGGG